ncbi:MAG: hypothetical protein Q8916_01875 [Bacteroidota bacterium]|nr:hypothetical protein [Bacteroidota bacterium]MDP4235446.1 hypothetical protein [Bacteroidota bacterium]
MRKTILLLALGMFLSTSVTANACDKEKASMKSSKAHGCCMKGKAMKDCMTKDGKDCSKDPNCVKDMKASKTSKTSLKKTEGKS